MSRKMSRAQPQAAFLEAATQMFEELEDWSDQHPDASFGEIEAEARRKRRELVGRALTVLIEGRAAGPSAVPPRCPQCGQPLEFQGYRKKTIGGLEGDTALRRTYYTCPRCKGPTLFPPRP